MNSGARAVDFEGRMLNNDKDKDMIQDQYYSIEEVASMLKVAYLTVYRWVRANKLVALKAGKQYRISKEVLDTFLSESK